MHTFFEKIDKFNNIVYDDKFHRYTIDGVTTVSVTKVTGAVVPPFDEIAQSESTAARMTAEGNPITPEELRSQWKENNLIAKEKGSAAHKYIESALANKFERYPAAYMRGVFGPTDPVVHKYNKVINHMNRFIADIRGKMIPIKSELVIGSKNYMVCGMIDQIFYNLKSKQFELWDWKTNTKFDMSSKFRLMDPCKHLAQCKLDEYSLQLACYKKMFTEETGIELGKSYIAWFSEAEPNYKVIPCKDLAAEATVLLQNATELINAKELMNTKGV